MHLDICIHVGHSPIFKVTDTSIIFKFPVSLCFFCVYDKNIECEIYPPNNIVLLTIGTLMYKISLELTHFFYIKKKNFN